MWNRFPNIFPPSPLNLKDTFWITLYSSYNAETKIYHHNSSPCLKKTKERFEKKNSQCFNNFKFIKHRSTFLYSSFKVDFSPLGHQTVKCPAIFVNSMQCTDRSNWCLICSIMFDRNSNLSLCHQNVCFMTRILKYWTWDCVISKKILAPLWPWSYLVKMQLSLLPKGSEGKKKPNAL